MVAEPLPPAPSWDEVAELIAKYGSQENAAKRIRQWREAEGWSTATLAEKVNMNQSSVWKIENPESPSGRRDISIRDAINFSRVFKKTVAEILLPDGALLHVDGWTAFREGANALNEIRNSTHEYEDMILKTRAYIRQSPELGQRIAEWLDEAKARIRAQTYPVWENDGGSRSPNPFFEDYVKGFITPAVIAAEDALGTHAIDKALWTRTARRANV